MSTPNLLTISGSLRRDSYNRMLLKEATDAFGDATVVEANLHLPLYDGDLEEAKGIPADVLELARQVKEADALLISTPEYNKGISGVLKNALDWLSRVEGAVLKNKPTVVMSAAAGRTGGETAQFMTLSCLSQLQVHLMPGPMIMVAAAMNEFDENGVLQNDLNRKTLATRMQALRAEIT